MNVFLQDLLSAHGMGIGRCSICKSNFTRSNSLALCLVCGVLVCESSLECGQGEEEPQRPLSLCRHAAQCGEHFIAIVLLVARGIRKGTSEKCSL